MDSLLRHQGIGIVGAGSWGTALSLHLLRNQYPVTLWGHDATALERMAQKRENQVYLPGISLPPELELTSDLERLTDKGLLLLVTPSRAIREVSARLSTLALHPTAILMSCTKGVERGSGLRMSEILREALPPSHPIAVLSGPSHAEEVAEGHPTAVVLGCEQEEVGKALQRVFCSAHFRAYTNTDVTGIELGGAIKNIFAIAAGIVDGLRLGDNAKAALLTRSLAELVRLGVALGGKRETFYGLSGVGDLMVTCFSRHSRNRAVGERLGKGESLGAITSSMQMVAEGIPATYSVAECARARGIETPIIDQIRLVLDGTLTPQEALAALFSRDPRSE